MVSLSGALPTARAGSSLLHAFGLAECAANSMEDYIGCAVALAQNHEKRTALRARLAASCVDQCGPIRSLENSFEEIMLNRLRNVSFAQKGL